MRRVKNPPARTSQIGFARPYPHYRPPHLVALPPLALLVVPDPGLEGGTEFRNLRSGSIHTAPNPAVKASASFCYWGQQGHMQWWHQARLTVHQERPWPLLVVLHCILPAPVDSCEFPLR